MPTRSLGSLALFLFLWAPVSAPAQTVRGTILGTVTDPSGAVTPRARVTFPGGGDRTDSFRVHEQ
jgi:hypothetical protein